MKRLIFPVVLSVGLIILAGVKTHELLNAKNPDPNHSHADFAVWIDRKQLDFSADKYMTKPGLDDTLPAGDPRKYFHLHDGNGHVIHRHKPGLGLDEFFKTIGFTLTDSCLTLDTNEKVCTTPDGSKAWRMYVNGVELSPVKPQYVFQDDDAILLTYGPNDSAEVRKELNAMSHDACLYSQTCPWRGKPPTENCIADPEVPCKA